MTLPNDVARCVGIGSEEDGWFEDCEICLRRLAPPGAVNMEPPAVITFFCEYQLEPGA
jgi:hypothetical protein